MMSSHSCDGMIIKRERFDPRCNMGATPDKKAFKTSMPPFASMYTTRDERVGVNDEMTHEGSRIVLFSISETTS